MSNEFSIVASAPLPASTGSTYVEKLITTNERYTITENVGFDTATFNLTGDPEYLKAWFAGGLARHIVWKAPDSSIAWEGYVSGLALSLGDRARTKSIDEMYNRVILVYTALDTSTDPPTAGAQATSTLNDTNSQALYGIKAAMLSGGECTAATAADDCLAELRKRRVIAIGEKVSTGKGKHPTLQVTMKGYGHMIDWCSYSASGDTGTQNSSTLVVAILAADPNAIANTSAVNIDACTTAMPVSFDGKKGSWALIQECAERGYESGGDAWPWTCGVYEGRTVTFKQSEGVDWAGLAESTNKHPIITYYPSRGIYIEDGGRELRDWEIRPDRLVRTYGGGSDVMYIRQVQWNAPTGMVLDGRDAQNPMRTYPREISSDSLDTLRAFTFTRDRDITMQSGRGIYLGDGTEIPSSSLVPIGGVIFWPSTAGAIPTGWTTFAAAQGRFLVGADGATFVNGATGGAETINLYHRHTYSDTTSSDAHTHGPGTLKTGSASTSTSAQAGTGQNVTTVAHEHHDYGWSGATASDSHSHTTSGNTNYQLSSTQSIIPPYLCGTWIQRTS